MDIHRIDPVIVDDRAQSWYGKCDFCMRVFSLQKVSVISGGKCIFTEIIQSQKCSKSNSAHASYQSTFLSIQAVRKNPFVTCKMESLILVRIISLLENSYIVCTAFMQVCILIRIHGIDFQTDDTELFFRNLTCLSDIFYIGFGTAFTGENQNFLKP